MRVFAAPEACSVSRLFVFLLLLLAATAAVAEEVPATGGDSVSYTHLTLLTIYSV